MILNPFRQFESISINLYLDLIRSSSSFDLSSLGSLFEDLKHGLNAIFTFWHREIMLHLLLNLYIEATNYVLVSEDQSADRYAILLRRMGIHQLRPNAEKGLKNQMVMAGRLLKKPGHILSLAVDGPFGPAGIVKSGICRLAAITGVPIIPIHCSALYFRIGNTWDKRIYPYPNNHFHFQAENPLYISQISNLNAISSAREKLQTVLDSFSS